MRRRMMLVALAALALNSVGCGGDDAVIIDPIDTEFRVEVKAVDVEGAPVAGLNVGVVNDVLVDTDKSDVRAVLTIPFVVPEESLVRLFIEDLEGNRSRTLVDEILSVSLHYMDWNGLDDEEEPLPAGRYIIKLRAFPPGGSEAIFSAEKEVFMQRAPTDVSLGRTGDEGVFVISDLRLFPGLFPLAAMVSTNHEGDRTGTVIELPTMTFAVWDDEGSSAVDAFAIDFGPNTVELIFIPEGIAVASKAPAPAPEIRHQGKLLLDEANFELRDPFPNPFN